VCIDVLGDFYHVLAWREVTGDSLCATHVCFNYMGISWWGIATALCPDMYSGPNVYVNVIRVFMTSETTTAFRRVNNCFLGCKPMRRGRGATAVNGVLGLLASRPDSLLFLSHTALLSICSRRSSAPNAELHPLKIRPFK